MKLDFHETQYAGDFEACADIPDSWGFSPERAARHFLRFKAYDTSCLENEREKELAARGIGFECFVWFGEYSDCVLTPVCQIAHFVADTREHAEGRFAELAAEYDNAVPDVLLKARDGHLG